MEPNEVFNNWKEILSDFTSSLYGGGLKQFSPYLTAASDTIIITCQCPIDNFWYL
jgi:hypothetical protein